MFVCTKFFYVLFIKKIIIIKIKIKIVTTIIKAIMGCNSLSKNECNNTNYNNNINDSMNQDNTTGRCISKKPFPFPAA